ncbi:LPS assembly lipoprotein LptE [Halomonas chromatireducens]|uniref:LPS-assembly lipoprotein LptE n=1 Tax=Halomonas chromatireducens TaxID=507626 RepID=A0A109UL61_9GAMM|nr:LPS assembly lipoprotein LptE [Halomonas chromatireducens]AMD00023.1 Lipopolysaccharide-assembly [Halomonas chromatireducens]
MQRRTFLGLLLTGSASLGLTGCGYRLRGLDATGPALSEIAIAGSESDLVGMVRERLESGDTRVHAQAPLVLNLGAEAFRERPLGIQGTGPREVEMELRVPYSVQRQSDGAYRLPQRQIEVVTRFTVSDDNLLAQEDIREEARQELRRDATRRLLDELRSLE